MEKITRSELIVTRKPEKIRRDSSRVITRLHIPDDPRRIAKIIKRVLDMTPVTAEAVLAKLMTDFAGRHKNINQIFADHLNNIKDFLPEGTAVSSTKKALIGAYFTMEYSIESAALFNPSIIPHPDQSNLPTGNIRFIMSLRATGEGHLSSIVFRSGVLDANNTIHLDTLSEFVVTPELRLDPIYDRTLFSRKLQEMGADNHVMRHLLSQLPGTFSFQSLQRHVEEMRANLQFPEELQNQTFELMFWLANSNYEICFEPTHLLSERVIFPTSRSESRGIEDARFVKFYNDVDQVTYFATYTAYNGVSILPQLIETRDFVNFRISTLNGAAVQNKGMALFPRKINDRYVMLSRQDGENNRIMFSENIHFWQTSETIQEPVQPWEFFQLGNCGSPLETTAGWLVLTHGVGPMRQYSIGAILLDLENPEKVIAYLAEPLLLPHEEEREGYVPNVVYSCGSLIHNGEVIIPYAMSDIMAGFATVNLADLLDHMRPVDES